MAEPEGPQASPIPQGAQDPPAPPALQALQQPIPHMPPLNWSHFKPKFSGNQKKMKKHIYLEIMTGWALIDFCK